MIEKMKIGLAFLYTMAYIMCVVIVVFIIENFVPRSAWMVLRDLSYTTFKVGRYNFHVEAMAVTFLLSLLPWFILHKYTNHLYSFLSRIFKILFSNIADTITRALSSMVFRIVIFGLQNRNDKNIEKPRGENKLIGRDSSET